MLRPFETSGSQQSFGLVAIILGLFFIVFSLPFVVAFGIISIATTFVGMIVLVTGLAYFFEVTG